MGHSIAPAADPAILDNPQRLAPLTGSVIDRAPDAVLDALVKEAAEVSGQPSATITLVGRRAQILRAVCGISGALGAARGTSRDASWCQITVSQDRPLEITDAREVEGLPQAPIDYGLRSYYGVPLHLKAQPIGALCVLSGEAATFSSGVKTQLAELAQRAEQRLEELLAMGEPPAEVVSHAAQPAFGELRNQLAVLESGLRYTELAAAEQAPILELMSAAAAGKVAGTELLAALPLMKGLGEDSDELRGAVEDMRAAQGLLVETFLALEGALDDPSAVTELGPALKAAGGLARHVTKLTGGVSWSAMAPGLSVRGSKPVVVTSVAAALRIVAEARPRTDTVAMRAQVRTVGPTVQLDLDCTAPAATEVQQALARVPGVQVRGGAGGVTLVWSAA